MAIAFTTRAFVLVCNAFKVYITPIKLSIGLIPKLSVQEIRQSICEFAKRQGRLLAEKILPLCVFEVNRYANGLDDYLDKSVAPCGQWGGCFEIVLLAVFFGILGVCLLPIFTSISFNDL